MPKINNWMKLGPYLMGEITGHNRQEKFKAPLQMTSRIIEMNEKEGWCRTQNTLYELGKERDKTLH